MEGTGTVLDQRREQVAVGPGNLLEVELEASVAVSLGLVDEIAGQRRAPVWIGEDGVPDAGVNIFIDYQRNDGNPVRVGRIDHIAPRIARDAAIRIGVVPGGAEHVDLLQMREQRGPAIVRVDVIHLHHVAGRHLGDGRWNRECSGCGLPAERAIGGLHARIKRDGHVAGQGKPGGNCIKRLVVAPGQSRVSGHVQVLLSLRVVHHRARKADGRRHADLSVGLQLIETRGDAGTQGRHDLKGGANVHRPR